MAVEIKSRGGIVVLYSCEEAHSIKACVERAVKEGANLVLADLTRAELRRADLRGAKLDWTDFMGADLYGANLSGASLNGANFRGADLAWVDLRWADLYGANLNGANLAGANFTGANLAGTDFAGATIGGAIGINKHLCTPLRILLEQPGLIRAYKLVTADGKSPIEGDHCRSFVTYEIGKSYEVSDACTDESKMCAAGIHLSTLDWCLKHWWEGWRILVAEFTKEDIAAIPVATDGRFRVRRCQIVGEKNLKELDWLPWTRQEDS